MQAMVADFNYSPTYGQKRSCDPEEDNEHAKSLASSKVVNSFSNRGASSIKDFARAVSALSSDQGAVGRFHLQAVAPYALARRMQWTDDFKKGGTAENRRKTSLELYCAEQVVNDFSGHFDNSVEDVKMLKRVQQELDIAVKDNEKVAGALTWEQAVKKSPVLQEKRISDRFKDVMESVARTQNDNPLIIEYGDYLIERYPEMIKRFAPQTADPAAKKP